LLRVPLALPFINVLPADPMDLPDARLPSNSVIRADSSCAELQAQQTNQSGHWWFLAPDADKAGEQFPPDQGQSSASS
jgi:hypothetical protein